MARARSSTPVAAESAFVLHRYDWSESSLILELWTRESGRVAVAAKGAKRPYSQLRSVLLPFQRLSVVYGSRKGEAVAEVSNLKSAEWAGGHAMLTGPALFAGFYLNELLLKSLTRQDPHPLLFDAYAQTVESLAHGADVQREAALRAFELLLMRETGFLPNLSQETTSQTPLLADRFYALRSTLGLGQATPVDGGIRASVWLSLEQALSMRALGALQAACLEALTPLKAQLRALLHYHVGAAGLRTRQVMIELQQTS